MNIGDCYYRCRRFQQALVGLFLQLSIHHFRKLVGYRIGCRSHTAAHDLADGRRQIF